MRCLGGLNVYVRIVMFLAVLADYLFVRKINLKNMWGERIAQPVGHVLQVNVINCVIGKERGKLIYGYKEQNLLLSTLGSTRKDLYTDIWDRQACRNYLDEDALQNNIVFFFILLKVYKSLLLLSM